MMKVWSMEKRKKGIRIDYRATESVLLKYLRNNSQITISGFCRIGKINRKKAEDILANLIALEILRISITEKGTWYSLDPDQKASEDYFSNLDRRE